MTTLTWNQLDDAVRRTPYDARVSLMTLDGQEWGYRADEACPSASVIKIAIMIEVFNQIDAGALSLDSPYRLGPDDKAPGSGVLQHMHDGLELTLWDLLYLMISISDNTATNMLIDVASLDSINQRMRSLGCTESVLNRKMWGRLTKPGEQENWLVPSECSRMIRAILTGEAASAASCEQMVELLKTQQNRQRLARPLTAEHEHIEFGSKNGWNKGISHDAGFFRVGDKTLILTVLQLEVADPNEGEAAIGAIAEAALKDAGML